MTVVLPSPHLRADLNNSPVPSFRDLYTSQSNNSSRTSLLQSQSWSTIDQQSMQNNVLLNRPSFQTKNSSSRRNTPSPNSSSSNLSGSNPSLSPARMPFPARVNPSLSHSTNSASSTSLSRLSSLSRSRRPSAALATLQSFLEGVEFATRCTGGSGDRRRGESRQASRQPTGTGLERGRTASIALPPKATRTFSQELQAFASDDEDEDELDFSNSSIADRTVRPEEDQEGEEDDEAAVFEEGERLEVGYLHAGKEVKVLELPAQGYTASPVRRLEIVRKLGSGSYAVVYLCRAIVYDPYEDGEDFEEGPMVYGQEFALKCLCKKNLSKDLLNVQKFEATLHHSLPAHQNIVALHGAFETDDWLFLILEYCPGQDLFYWLEQARDHEDVEELMHPSASFQHATKSKMPTRLAAAWGPESHSATPPSPSLLSMTSMNQLLSRRRLRLISRMFIQMCDAVDACHRMGISHRDIKPENFICCEEDDKGIERRVMVKLTDWGLGTRDAECTDFDCGSKPYMAYECRNNLGPTYRPIEADIWSLGIVFLNLLFHRCPWSDPSLSDPDFAEYCRNPVRFLNDRFEGIGPEVSSFLAAKVLNCEGPRASAADFSKWASRLVSHMSEPRAPTLVSESAVPLKATRPSEKRLSQILSESSSTRPSPRSSLLAQYMISVPGSPATDSPTSPSPMSPNLDLPSDLKASLAQDDVFKSSAPAFSPSIDAKSGLGLVSSPLAQESLALPQPDILPVTIDPTGDSAQVDAEAAALAAKAKRRKRGARRGRSHAKTGLDHQDVTATQAPTEPKSATPDNRDRQLDDLADASVRLARELSKQPKAGRPPLPSSKSTGGFVGKFKGSMSGGHAGLEALAQQKQKRETKWNGGTYSAPADMQHTTSSTSTGSNSSFGTNSWSAGETKSHWGSTGARRQRQTMSRFNPESQSASSHSHSSSPSPSRFSHSTSDASSPISSIASKSSACPPPMEQTKQAPAAEQVVRPSAASIKSTASVKSVDSSDTLPAPTKGKISKIFSRFGR